VLFKSLTILPDDGLCSEECPQNNGSRCKVYGSRTTEGYACTPYIYLLRHQVSEAREVAERALLGDWKDPVPWEGEDGEEDA